MNAIKALQTEANQAFAELLEALQHVDEPTSWGVMPGVDLSKLNTSATIIGLIHHVAGCKKMYASAAFKNMELDWFAVADELDATESNLEKSIGYLRESHDYWMASWQDLQPEELQRTRDTNWRSEWPTWRIIYTVTAHDSYHGGQINLMKAAVIPADVPPPTEADDIRRYIRETSTR